MIMKLAVYGTLRQGEENHHFLSGDPTYDVVRGIVLDNVLYLDLPGAVPVEVYDVDDFETLDEFEEGYQRVWAGEFWVYVGAAERV